MDYWLGERCLDVVASEFWNEFSASWDALKTFWLGEFASKNAADEVVFRAFEELHRTAFGLHTLLRSLSDNLSNRVSVEKGSTFTALRVFVHDLRAPLAAVLSFSDPIVTNALNEQASFLLWRDSMSARIERVTHIVDNVIVNDRMSFAYSTGTL